MLTNIHILLKACVIVRDIYLCQVSLYVLNKLSFYVNESYNCVEVAASFARIPSDVNKDLGFKAEAEATDLGFKAKAKDLSFKAKDLSFKAKAKDLSIKAKAKDLRIGP